MREIKFRAWDKEIERMSSPDFVLGESTEINYKDIFSGRELEIMQDTGLKDKNGKDIYEGDILENKTIEIEEDNKEELGDYWRDFVIFHAGMFTTKDDGLGSGDSLFEIINSITREVEVEVIGNIYENPELIKL